MRARALLSIAMVGLAAACGDPASTGAPPTPGPTDAAVQTAVATPDPAACPADAFRETGGDAVVDWVDFVHVAGRMYDIASESNLDPSMLGPVIGVVCFTLDGRVSNPDYRPIDGDASFLPEGTEIHALGDAEPPLRVAVVGPGAGRVTVYEPSAVDGGASGADVIDLASPIAEVRWFDLVSGERLGAVGEETEPEVLGTMIGALAAAAIDTEFDPDAVPSDSGYMIEVARDDGTVTRRVSWVTDDGLVVAPGIVVGHAWDDVLSDDRSIVITGVYERFAFYDPCGTSTIEVAGTTWYQMYSEDESLQERLTYPKPPTAPPTTAPAVQGFARVAPPGPGDDIGVLVTYSDGTARFESESGLVEWFTTHERTYDWVC